MLERVEEVVGVISRAILIAGFIYAFLEFADFLALIVPPRF